MSKFFAQLLLSVVLSVGAVVGFRSDVRGELHKALREAKVVINEKVNIDFKSTGDVKTQVNTAASISAKENGALSAKVTAKTNAKARGNLNSQVSNNAQVSTGGAVSTELIPNVSLDSSLNTNSQTNVGADIQDLNVDLKNQLKSTSDLNLNLK